MTFEQARGVIVAIPKTMRGVLLTGHGGPEKLVVRDDVPVPHPESTDVLVHVEAASVNNTDINTREAWYSKGKNETADAGWSGNALKFPRIQGADVCGTIVQAGTEVDEARVGERVLIEPCLREANGKLLESPWYLGSECDGGFAEYVVVASRHAYKIDSPLSSTELASFPCSYSTAENMLTRADVKDKDHVLITGASGGVGSAAIQLAKARGAHVTAVTSSPKATRLRDIGADETVTRHEDLTASLGVDSIDVVVDLVAGPSWASLLKVLRPGGRYAVSGAIGGPIVELDVRTLYLKDLSFFGCTVLEPEVFTNLIRQIEQGRVMPLIARTYPLSRIEEAQKAFLSKNHVGKIVIGVADSSDSQ